MCNQCGYQQVSYAFDRGAIHEAILPHCLRPRLKGPARIEAAMQHFAAAAARKAVRLHSMAVVADVIRGVRT